MSDASVSWFFQHLLIYETTGMTWSRLSRCTMRSRIVFLSWSWSRWSSSWKFVSKILMSKLRTRSWSCWCTFTISSRIKRCTGEASVFILKYPGSRMVNSIHLNHLLGWVWNFEKDSNLKRFNTLRMPTEALMHLMHTNSSWRSPSSSLDVLFSRQIW